MFLIFSFPFSAWILASGSPLCQRLAWLWWAAGRGAGRTGEAWTRWTGPCAVVTSCPVVQLLRNDVTYKL